MVTDNDLIPAPADTAADNEQVDPFEALPDRDGLHLMFGGLPLHIPSALVRKGADWLWDKQRPAVHDRHDLIFELAYKGFARALALYINYHVDAGHVDWPRLNVPRGADSISYTMHYITDRLLSYVSRADWHIQYQEEPGADGSLVLAGVVPAAPGLAPTRSAQRLALAAGDGSTGGGGGAAPAGDTTRSGPRGGSPAATPDHD